MSLDSLNPDFSTNYDFRTYLHLEFVKRCRDNQKYNLSSFAKFLKTDKSTLGKILKGKRPVKAIAIKRLGNQLGLNTDLIEEFIKKSPRANAALVAGETNETIQGSFQSSINLSIGIDKIPEAKKLITNLQSDFNKLLEDDVKDAKKLYLLNISLLPL